MRPLSLLALYLSMALGCSTETTPSESPSEKRSEAETPKSEPLTWKMNGKTVSVSSAVAFKINFNNGAQINFFESETSCDDATTGNGGSLFSVGVVTNGSFPEGGPYQARSGGLLFDGENEWTPVDGGTITVTASTPEFVSFDIDFRSEQCRWFQGCPDGAKCEQGTCKDGKCVRDCGFELKGPFSATRCPAKG